MASKVYTRSHSENSVVALGRQYSVLQEMFQGSKKFSWGASKEATKAMPLSSDILCNQMQLRCKPSCLGTQQVWKIAMNGQNAKHTPRAISAKMHPMLQMSTGNEYTLVPSSTSGERYHRVTTSWVYAFTGMENVRPSPRSAILSRPLSGSTKMFCGLRSRCIMPCWCMYAIPLSSWNMNGCMAYSGCQQPV
jgi:hypothetical protein